jgi:hypothetical protein
MGISNHTPYMAVIDGLGLAENDVLKYKHRIFHLHHEPELGEISREWTPKSLNI